MAIDPVAFAQDLIRCPSVTPKDEGVMAVLENALIGLGFTCHRLHFAEPGTEAVENLYARIGVHTPNFCFAGHVDVVPPGAEHWSVPPFEARIDNGWLIGRGAADMKGAIAAFVAAVSRLLEKGLPKGSISFLITGDEEGDAVNGTPKILDWLKARGEKIDHSLFGEPSSVKTICDTIKIGRRGSLNVHLTAHGTQGHVAYGEHLKNPVHALANLVSLLTAQPLDKGSDVFDPSTLSFSTFDVGNPTGNIVPATARAAFNIRFSDLQTPEGLISYIRAAADRVATQTGCTIDVETALSGLASVERPGSYTALLQGAIATVTGAQPAMTTAGGTSDARFITDFCPAVELGLKTNTMHQVDERVPVSDLLRLTEVYEAILGAYFAAPPV